jgi:predicted transcriptional regulator of viral defense system
MIVNNNSSKDQIQKILKEQNGILRTSDLTKSRIPRTYLTLMEQAGEIERVSRGIYHATAEIEDEMFNFQARYKTTIFSHETALYLHGLTDRTPSRYSITVPAGYHSISLKEDGQKIFYINRKLFGLGVIPMKSFHGNQIRTTNLERTICDILRNRNQIDVYLINEALKQYVKFREMNLPQLYTYAQQFHLQTVVRQKIEILL